jgi:hypothetical protein
MASIVKKPKSKSTISNDIHEPTQFYDLVKKDPVLAKLYNYPNKPEIQINLPCRILMVGGTGTGKTTTALEIIRVIGVFEKIIIIAKLMDEPLYQYLKDRAEAIAEKNQVSLEEIFILSNDLNDIPQQGEFDKWQNSLIIIDDFVNSKPQELKHVLTLWILGRKLSISMFWLSQNFFSTEKIIRNNCGYVVLKKIFDARNLNNIVKTYALDTPVKEIQKMCKKANVGGNTSFFFIDCITDNPNMRFRSNFKGFPAIEEKEEEKKS